MIPGPTPLPPHYAGRGWVIELTDVVCVWYGFEVDLLLIVYLVDPVIQRMLNDIPENVVKFSLEHLQVRGAMVNPTEIGSPKNPV